MAMIEDVPLDRWSAPFQQLFDFAPDGELVIDSLGRIVLANARAAAMLGYSRDELAGQSLGLLIPDRLRGKHSEHFRNYFAYPAVRPMGSHAPFTARRRDGSEFPVEISLAPLPTEEGTIVLCSIRDVTEQRRLACVLAEQLEIQGVTAQILRLSLEPVTLPLLLERTLDLVLAVPWVGRVGAGSIYLMDNAAGILVLQTHRGVPPDVVARCQRISLDQSLCGESASHRRLVYTPCLERHHLVSIPALTRHGLYSVPLMADGDIVGVMNLWVPPEHEPRAEQEAFLETTGHLLAGIIKRKRTEARLQQSEERFALAVQGTNAGIWDWDLLTNQVYFSPRWKRILGYGPDEISNDFSEWETRLHPEDHDRAMATVKDYLEGRTVDYELEHRLRHKDGRYRWILARGAAVFDGQSRPYRFVGSHLDITRRREAEERLGRHRAELLAAQQIQQSLLPQSPPRIPGLDIAGGCYPAQYAAGDGFDYMVLPDGSLFLMIADVVGKGIGPALLMATTGAYLRALASAGLPLARLVNQTNVMLVTRSDSDRFVTLMVCCIDPATGSLRYVNAGHPHGYLIDATGAVKATLHSGQMPIGVLPDIEYRESSGPVMSVGDTLVLLTDGVLEARSPEGVLFGTRRLLDLVCAHRDQPSEKIVRLVREEVMCFTGQSEFQDDLTMIVVRLQHPAPPSSDSG